MSIVHILLMADVAALPWRWLSNPEAWSGASAAIWSLSAGAEVAELWEPDGIEGTGTEADGAGAGPARKLSILVAEALTRPSRGPPAGG